MPLPLLGLQCNPKARATYSRASTSGIFHCVTHGRTQGALASLALVIASIALAPGALARNTFNVDVPDLVLRYVMPDVKFERNRFFHVIRQWRSSSDRVGLFGRGWSFSYGDRLTVHGDGAVTMTVYTGKEYVFYPPVQDTDDVATAVVAIVEATKGVWSMEAARQAAYARHLRENAEYRRKEWTKHVRAGRLAARVIPVGERLVTGCSDGLYAVRTPLGFKVIERYDRPSHHGIHTHVFDRSGRLLQVSGRLVDKPSEILGAAPTRRFAWNYVVQLRYDADGRLQRMDDSDGRTVRFEYGPDGLVETLQAPNGRATFAYDGQKRLVRSSNIWKEHYRYRWTEDHKLLGVYHRDRPILDVTWEYQSARPRIARAPGDVNMFQFAEGGDRQRRAKTAVQYRRSRRGRSTTRSQHVTVRDPVDGTWWTQRIWRRDGRSSVSHTLDRCGRVLINHRRNGKVTYERDVGGRVIKVERGQVVTALQYGARGQVLRLETTKPASKGSAITRLRYDERGRVSQVQLPDGRSVFAEYRPGGDIVRITRGSDEIEFEKKAGRWRLTHPRLGTVVAWKDARGKTQVEKPDGPEKAAALITLYRELRAALDIAEDTVGE